MTFAVLRGAAVAVAILLALQVAMPAAAQRNRHVMMDGTSFPFTFPSGRASSNFRDFMFRHTRPTMNRFSSLSPQTLDFRHNSARSFSTAIMGNNIGSATSALGTATNADMLGETLAQGMALASTNPARATAIATANAGAMMGFLRRPMFAQGLARASAIALARGQGTAWSNTMAQAFALAQAGGNMGPFAQATANAIVGGGPGSATAFGLAMAQAIANGGSGRMAVANAMATAFCAGSIQANALAAAMAVAVTQNPQSCGVLNQAETMANTMCGGGVFDTAGATANAATMVLGSCDMLPDGFAMPADAGTTDSASPDTDTD